MEKVDATVSVTNVYVGVDTLHLKNIFKTFHSFLFTRVKVVFNF